MIQKTNSARTCGFAIAVLLGLSAGPAHAGIVSHWALDEGVGSGGPAADSADGNPGTLVNTTYIAPGKFGASAINLNDNGYIRTGNPANLQFDSSDPFTVMAFVRGTGIGDDTIAGKMISGGTYTGYELHIGSTAGAGKVNVWLISAWSGNVIEMNSSIAVNDGNWHHVAFTYDGSSSASGVQIYVDGNPDAGQTIGKNTLTGSIKNTTTEFNIGSRQNGAAHNYTGDIDDVAVFDTALNASDISSIAQIGVAAWVPEPTSFVLSALGLLGLLSWGWRRRTKDEGLRTKRLQI